MKNKFYIVSTFIMTVVFFLFPLESLADTNNSGDVNVLNVYTSDFNNNKSVIYDYIKSNDLAVVDVKDMKLNEGKDVKDHQVIVKIPNAVDKSDIVSDLTEMSESIVVKDVVNRKTTVDNVVDYSLEKDQIKIILKESESTSTVITEVLFNVLLVTATILVVLRVIQIRRIRRY